MLYQVDIEITCSAALEPQSSDFGLVHGVTTSTAQFRITSGLRPSELQMNHLLSLYCDEWCLTHFDYVAGVGQFSTVDLNAPERGIEITLKCESRWPDARLIVIERCTASNT